MNRKVLFPALVLGLLFAQGIAFAAELNVIEIGISPYETAQASASVRRQVGQLILEGAPNTTIVVYDAYALTLIASFQIPQLQFDSPAERAQRLAEPFSRLANWYKKLGVMAVPPSLKDTGALKVPEFLSALSEQRSTEPYAILLIGSPIDYSIKEPTFSMAGGKVPSDGLITAKLTESIYGTADKHAKLNNVLVHFCYLNEELWPSQFAKENVQRFWSLFVSQQGGHLVDFTPDIKRAFSTVSHSDLGPVGDYKLDPTDSALEMRVLKERTLRTREEKGLVVTPAVSMQAPHAIDTPPIPPSVGVRGDVSSENVKETSIAITTKKPSVPTPVALCVPTPLVPLRKVVTPIEMTTTNRTTSPNDLPPIPIAPTGHIGIAAWWQADADVDLHISVAGQRELYYGNVRNKSGTYFRDIRRANQANSEQVWRDRWEYVELSKNVPIDGIDCWLNLYRVNESDGKPISGKVRIQYADGHMAEVPFRFDVETGNEGACSTTRARSSHWIHINIRPSTH